MQSKISQSAKREAGSAAVELALIMPILVVFLTMCFFYASCFWHYTAAQKAAQDAARYLSSVPHAEMMSPTMAQEAGALAVALARKEMAELSPSSSIIGPTAYCDSVVCGELSKGRVPTTVRVRLTFSMSDPLGFVDAGWYGIDITADYTMPYVGT